MPERPRSFARWRALGRFLPDEVRQAAAIRTYLGCIPIAVPHLFVRRGRLTRLGKGLVWAASGLTVVWLVLLRLSNIYAETRAAP